jgi:hypothetical protein
MISADYSHMPIQKSKSIRRINKCTIYDFLNKLSKESYVTIFNSDDVNAMFNPLWDILGLFTELQL